MMKPEDSIEYNVVKAQRDLLEAATDIADSDDASKLEIFEELQGWLHEQLDVSQHKLDELTKDFKTKYEL